MRTEEQDQLRYLPCTMGHFKDVDSVREEDRSTENGTVFMGDRIYVPKDVTCTGHLQVYGSLVLLVTANKID